MRLIVFDWDGTLMDSTAHITGAIQKACADLNLPIPSEAQARHVIGLGLSDALQVACPDVPADKIGALVDAYRRHFFTGDETVKLFEGVIEALQFFAEQALFLAIATGKSRLGLDRVLAQTGLKPYFAATRTVDECPSKPHPQMLLDLMDFFGVDAKDTLMIGDTTHDLFMAKNARARAIGIESGAHTRQQLLSAEPEQCFANFIKCDQWLRSQITSSATPTNF